LWCGNSQAAAAGCTEVALALKDAGVDPMATNDVGETAIIKAAWGGYTSTVIVRTCAMVCGVSYRACLRGVLGFNACVISGGCALLASYVLFGVWFRI
jgi:hypothetical protein